MNTNTEPQIDLITPAMELHRSGCADVKRSLRRGRTSQNEEAARVATFAGHTLVDAIIAADTEMAGYFCEEPYTQDSRNNGCWTVLKCHRAPCLSFAGVTFDPETGRPS